MDYDLMSRKAAIESAIDEKPVIKKLCKTRGKRSNAKEHIAKHLTRNHGHRVDLTENTDTMPQWMSYPKENGNRSKIKSRCGKHGRSPLPFCDL